MTHADATTIDATIPRQVWLCDPNRLLSSLPPFSAHCHARSLLPTVVNHSTIYDENPDLHHGLLVLTAIENLDPAHWHDILLNGPQRSQQVQKAKTLIR